MSGGPGHHTFDTARNAARAEYTWFLRHADTLRRWPVLGEPWAQTVEARRLEAESPSRRDDTHLHGFRSGWLGK
jgi:hypothetical protein